MLVLQHTCHAVLMLLTLLRSLGMAPCPDAVSAEAAAVANTCRTGSPAHAAAIIEPPLPEPEPDVDTDVGSEDIDLALYCMEITDDQADPVPAAEPPEEPMPWTEPAVYCETCQMWLNGQEQWDDHVGGKKHRKNVRRERERAASGEVLCPYCQMWLRDFDEYETHLSSEPHRRNLSRLDNPQQHS